MLRLTLLAPEIVEAIMDGRQPEGLTLPALMKGFRSIGCNNDFSERIGWHDFRMAGMSAPLQILQLILSTTLLSLFFAAGMAIMLTPLGFLIDLADTSNGSRGLLVVSGIAGLAGLAFGLGTAWYSRHLDSRIPLPELTSGEMIQFRQFGYAISSTKYDPARIIVTNRRLFLQPVLFNPGGRIPSLEAPLSEISAMKDKAFGRHLARSFRLIAIRQKIVFRAAGRQIAYMANLGYPLPALRLFNRHQTP